MGTAQGSSERAGVRIADEGLVELHTKKVSMPEVKMIGKLSPTADRSAAASWALPQALGGGFVEPPSPDHDLAWLLGLEPLPVDFSPKCSHTGAGFKGTSPPAISTPNGLQPGSVDSQNSSAGKRADLQFAPADENCSNSGALAAFDALMRWDPSTAPSFEIVQSCPTSSIQPRGPYAHSLWGHGILPFMIQL